MQLYNRVFFPFIEVIIPIPISKAPLNFVTSNCRPLVSLKIVPKTVNKKARHKLLRQALFSQIVESLVENIFISTSKEIARLSK